MTDLYYTGFDNEKYLIEQTASILERVERFNNKLYLEFGVSCFMTIMHRESFRVSTRTSR